MKFWNPSWEEIVAHGQRVLGRPVPPMLARPLFYLTTPVAIWMVAAAGLMAAGAAYLLARIRGTSAQTRYGVLVLTLAILHAAFLFGFYGWAQSWTYYAYMPFVGLALVVSKLRLGKVAAVGLCLVALLAHLQALGQALGGWQYTVRTEDTSGLFAWEKTAAEWSHVRELAGDEPTLLMTNGYPIRLPERMELPDAWFPETGIATPVEVARVLGQVRRVEAVIIWREYGSLDLWNTPEFAPEKAQYVRTYQGQYFELWERAK